jgi:hypothetical protein
MFRCRSLPPPRATGGDSIFRVLSLPAGKSNVTDYPFLHTHAGFKFWRGIPEGPFLGKWKCRVG